MLYSELKTIATVMSPQSVGTFVSKDSGAIPEFALYARITNMEIAGHSHKFSWALRTYTLTLTTATSYNLATLIPDLAQVYQLSGETLPGRQANVMPLNEFNIASGGTIFTFRGKTLLVKNPPTSGGTIEIPYFSTYLVQANDGTRKLDFTADTDVSIIPEEHSPMLLEGILRFVYRKENSGKGKANQYVRTVQLWDGRVVDLDPFTHLLEQSALSDVTLTKSVNDFRSNIV